MRREHVASDLRMTQVLTDLLEEVQQDAVAGARPEMPAPVRDRRRSGGHVGGGDVVEEPFPGPCGQRQDRRGAVQLYRRQCSMLLWRRWWFQQSTHSAVANFTSESFR